MKPTSRQWRWLTIAAVIAILLVTSGPESLIFVSLLDSIGIEVFIALIALQLSGVCSAALNPWAQETTRQYLEWAKHFLRSIARAIPNIGSMTQGAHVALLFAAVCAGKWVLLGAKLLERTLHKSL